MGARRPRWAIPPHHDRFAVSAGRRSRHLVAMGPSDPFGVFYVGVVAGAEHSIDHQALRW